MRNVSGASVQRTHRADSRNYGESDGEATGAHLRGWHRRASSAFWLDRSDFDVTVVERAPALREGGQAVDFRGPVHREVLERMNFWDAIHQHRTRDCDVILLDRRGRPLITLPSVMMSGDVEIRRGDLSRLLYERTAGSVCYRFGDEIIAMAEGDMGVAVRFRSGDSRA